MGIIICEPTPVEFAHQQLAWIKVCIPDGVICDPNPKDGILNDCENTWNQIYCKTDRPFSMQYRRGDLIQFQTKFRDFWNDEAEQPDQGWNDFAIARLYNDENNQLLSDNVNDFASRFYVGWNGKESIQVIEIDTNKEIFDDVDCWHIEFESRYVVVDAEENETVIIDGTLCTEQFCDCGDCETWPTFEATHKSYDGHGYWHGNVSSWVGNSFFLFNPIYRFPVEVVQTGTRTRRIISPTDTVDFDTALIYTGGTIMLVPPFVLNMLSLGYLTAKNIIVNGVNYDTEDSEITRRNTGSEMQMFNFNLFKNGSKDQINC
jgi:hypothetical protein